MLHSWEKIKVHIKVYLVGRCAKCNKINQKEIYDYGLSTAKETEDRMENVHHAILPLQCSSCGEQYSPEYLIYKDLLSKREITKLKILHGSEMSKEEFLRMEAGNKRRREIFQKHEEEFWEKYIQYAFQNWRAIIQELTLEELSETYKKLEIKHELKTAKQFRRDALQRFTSDEQKVLFWKTVNHYFIYEHLLDLGPLAWYPEGDVEMYGPLRMRFIILHFPMDEALEPLRTKMIGKIIKTEKGDNAFLFERISQLTDEIERLSHRMSEYHHKNETLKSELAEKEKTIHELKKELQKEKEKEPLVNRDPKDIRKIQELKNLVSELLQEIKNQRVHTETIQPENEPKQEPPQLEIKPIEQKKSNYDVINGKTIGVIGAKRNEKISYPTFEILTHDGNKTDSEMLQVLKSSDILVILTKFVSHIAMWEAKAWAIEHDVPIFFVKQINMDLILNEVVQGIHNDTRTNG